MTSKAEKKAHAKAYAKAWGIRNKERLKLYRKSADLKKNYGITLEEYNAKLVSQQGVCAICQQPETQINHINKMPYSLSVDHCHKTNHVRELLCNRCNRALGMVNDDTELLVKMIKYIEAHSV